MTASIQQLGHFVQAGVAAQRAVDSILDRALQRHGLLQLVRERRDALRSLRDRRATLGEIEHAQLLLGFAELALDDFDHAGRAVR